MSCCGQKRVDFKRNQNISIANPEPQGLGPLTTPKEEIKAHFRYEGSSFLKVKGAITNTTYTFRYQGHFLTIDSRDIPAMMAEPDLQLVSQYQDS